MSEPNRLSVPGEHAARERVEAVFAHVDELQPLGIPSVVVQQRDHDEREALLAELERAADARGLGPLLDEAREAVRDALMARMTEDLPAGTYVARAQDGGRPEDRVALVEAIEDAVAVAVAEDAVEPDVALALSEPGRAILGLPPLHVPTRRHATHEERGAVPDAEPPDTGGAAPSVGGVWRPSARDWAEAERGAASIDRGAWLPGVNGLRIAFFVVVALTGVPAALAWGWTQGDPLLGLLLAVAVVLTCWTLATFRRAR